MEGLIISETKIQMTYLQGRKTYLSLLFIQNEPIERHPVFFFSALTKVKK